MREARLEAKTVRMLLPNDGAGEVTFGALQFKKPEVMRLLGMRFVPVLVKMEDNGCQLRCENFVLTLPGRKDADKLRVKLLSPPDDESLATLRHLQAVSAGMKEDEVAPLVLMISTLQVKLEDVPKKKPRRKKAAEKAGQGVMQIEPGEKPRQFAKRTFRKLKGDMEKQGVEFSVSAGGLERVAKAAGKKES